ncbi:T9SS type A sorting domain-containing protein, partial [Bacteroidota bacterium]
LGQDAFFMFKILNDSVRNGTKAADDPADFELVEVLAMEDYDLKWWPTGEKQITQGDHMVRKPEFTIPNNVAFGSFGLTPEESEWIYFDWDNEDQFDVESQLGDHFFVKPTFYISTVKAIIYKVSKGYSDSETLEGVKTGATVTEMISNLYKADPGQTLTVERAGNALNDGDAIAEGDVLVVVSTNGENTTKYTISVSEAGLSDDATLSSSVYTVEEDVTAGTGGVADMAFGTALTEVLDNVSAHEGAVISVLGADGLNIPFKRLNYFNEYVTSTAGYDTYFEVIAENTVDKILYQLQPAVDGDTAFITSSLYDVTDEQIIRYIPLGTSYVVFMSNIIASPGATAQVFDKFGYERTSGNLAQDDKVVATSPTGDVQTVYYLSLLDEEMNQTVPSLAFITSNVYWVDQVAFMIDMVGTGTTVDAFKANIDPATDALVQIFDADGNERSSGVLANTDLVKVTSANGSLTVSYAFGTFIPIITSDVYAIDQSTLVITGVIEQTTIVQLLDSIVASSGAVIKVVDAGGVEKASGELAQDDKVQVSSGDKIVEYTFATFDPYVGIDALNAGIKLYPNPTSSSIYIDGLNPGDRIQVYNVTGKLVRDVYSDNMQNTISLDGEADGLYLFVISKESVPVIHYKVIKE